MYYRGCWHIVSRDLFLGYRPLSSPRKGFYDPRAFITHAALLPQAFAIGQNSSLLPPVGVWTVSQCQCGGPRSHVPYPSLPW